MLEASFVDPFSIKTLRVLNLDTRLGIGTVFESRSKIEYVKRSFDHELGVCACEDTRQNNTSSVNFGDTHEVMLEVR